MEKLLSVAADMRTHRRPIPKHVGVFMAQSQRLRRFIYNDHFRIWTFLAGMLMDMGDDDIEYCSVEESFSVQALSLRWRLRLVGTLSCLLAGMGTDATYLGSLLRP